MTMIELMMAILILGIVLSALASTLVTSLDAVQRNERQVRATHLSNELLENMQAIDYFKAGLYESEATAHWGGAQFEGEDLVLLPNVATRDPDVPLPQETLTRGGIDFTVERAVTWHDDPDPSAPGTEDYKRFVVLLTWEHKGAMRTARSEALRAPNPGEGILRTSIREDPSTSDGDGIIALEPVPPSTSTDPHGKNAEGFIFEAFTKIPVKSLKVTFVPRDETTQTTVHLTHEGDNQTWDSTVNNPGAYRFTNGEALFEFTAVDFEDDAHVAVGRALFLHPLAIRNVTVGTTPVGTVDASGMPCFTQLTLEVDIHGALVSDIAEAAWSPGPATDAIPSVGATDAGARFVRTYEDVSEFTFPSIPPPVPSDSTVSTDVSVTANRAADSQEADTTTTVTFDRVDAC